MFLKTHIKVVGAVLVCLCLGVGVWRPCQQLCLQPTETWDTARSCCENRNLKWIAFWSWQTLLLHLVWYLDVFGVYLKNVSDCIWFCNPLCLCERNEVKLDATWPTCKSLPTSYLFSVHNQQLDRITIKLRTLNKRWAHLLFKVLLQPLINSLETHFCFVKCHFFFLLWP